MCGYLQESERYFFACDLRDFFKWFLCQASFVISRELWNLRFLCSWSCSSVPDFCVLHYCDYLEDLCPNSCTVYSSFVCFCCCFASTSVRIKLHISLQKTRASSIHNSILLCFNAPLPTVHPIIEGALEVINENLFQKGRLPGTACAIWKFGFLSSPLHRRLSEAFRASLPVFT